jgi:hypothetical protein
LRPGEWLRFGLWLAAVARLTPARHRTFAARLVREASGSHSAIPMPEILGSFRTILDVFDSIDPDLHTGPAGPGAPR